MSERVGRSVSGCVKGYENEGGLEDELEDELEERKETTKMA